MSKPLVVIIANPAASGFQSDDFRRAVRILGDAFEVEPEWPRSPAANTDLSRSAAQRGAHAVVAMGGDGVVHHAAQGVVGSNTALGIISAGTTNVLSRMLHLPQRSRAAAIQLKTATATDVPTIELLLTSDDGSIARHHALFAAGIGFDAKVVDIAERDPWRKKAFGSGHYLASTLGALRAYRKIKPNIAAVTSETALEGVSALLQVHDPYTYFGRFPLSLGSAPRDAFHLGVIKKLPTRAIPAIAWAAFRSKIGETKHVTVAENLESVDFECPESNLVQADGELLGEAVAVSARYVGTGLKILI